MNVIWLRTFLNCEDQWNEKDTKHESIIRERDKEIY